MKKVIKVLAKSVLITLGLTAVAAAVGVGMHKRTLGSGTTTPIISNYEMKSIMEIVKSYQDFGLLLKGVS